jgi:hypothetical protein
MSNLSLWLALCCFAFSLAGCVRNRMFVVAEPVGPSLRTGRNVLGQGSLIVYSAWDGFDTMDADHEKHTPYVICSDKGSVVKRVRNRCGSFDQEPMVVRLPVGTYRLEARASNLGLVLVPVHIEENQTTFVYLDGTTKPGGVESSESDLVKLPNGQIIGWRSRTTASIH